MNYQPYLPSASDLGISSNEGFDKHFEKNNIYFNYAFKILPIEEKDKIETVEIKSLFRFKHPTDNFHNTISIKSEFRLLDILYTLNTHQVYQLFDHHYQNCYSILLETEFPHPNSMMFSKVNLLDFGGFPYYYTEKVAEMIEKCGRTPC